MNIACCPLLIAYCLLLTAYCLLLIAYCLLHAALLLARAPFLRVAPPHPKVLHALHSSRCHTLPMLDEKVLQGCRAHLATMRRQTISNG